MDFDKDNKPGDELEDYGDELSSDYKEEAEERLGEEGEELEEEVSYKVEETVTVEKAPKFRPPQRLLNRPRLPHLLGRREKRPRSRKKAKRKPKAKPKAKPKKRPAKKLVKKAAKPAKPAKKPLPRKRAEQGSWLRLRRPAGGFVSSLKVSPRVGGRGGVPGLPV